METHVEKLSRGVNVAATLCSVGPYSSETRTDLVPSRQCFKTKGCSETTLCTMSINSWDALRLTWLTQSHLCHPDQLAQTCSLLCLPALLHREGIQFSPQKDMPTLGLCRPAVTKDIDVEPNYLANICVPLQHYTHSSLQQPHRLSEPLHPSSLLTVTCQTQNNTWINTTASMKQLTQLCPQLPCGWLT